MARLYQIISKSLLAILSLRYQIRIQGFEDLNSSKNKGYLFMPNHSALIDPLILCLLFWPKYRIRPIVTESMFELWFLKPFMKFMGAICIPNLTGKINQLKIKKTKDAIQELIDGLHAGDNFIFYPSGALKSSGHEFLGGSSGTHEVLSRCPDANIILVRTSGLWGSHFSKAIEGETPDLLKTLLKGFFTLLKNGIFFTPRRKVLIEVEMAPVDFPRSGSRTEINRALEKWYNRYQTEEGTFSDEEPLRLVSYCFWRKQVPQIQPLEKVASESDKIKISEETTQKIYQEVRSTLDQEELEIRPEMKLTTDLNMDSLNIADVIAFLSQEFKTEDVHPEDIETVQDVLAFAQQAKDQKKRKKNNLQTHFKFEKKRPSPAAPVGNSVMEAFLLSCQKMGNFEALGDDLVGIMSYKKLKRSVLILADHLKKLDGDRIAVLLPASAGAYLVILAILFAKKIPVMLNWTLGPKYLNEMLRISDTKTTITSSRFLERIPHVELGNVLDSVLLLEDIRKGLKITSKLKGLLMSLGSPLWILRSYKLHSITKSDPAVILFTSGTEASPKGVPLSHQNILSNQRALFQCFDSYATDIIYSILPPFHSFGFCLTGILPLICGLKVAYFPDPTDSFALAEGIERWKITFFCSAPNFLKSLLSTAKPDELKSVRLFLTGAEKTPQELFDAVQKLGEDTKLIEGYGITECAPVISLNRLNIPPVGVGHLLPNVDAITIHPETTTILKKGEEGEICVRGPNVFNGYLGNAKSPFIELEGKQWYRTGDIGYFDEEDHLILSGRFKRFTKIGGEMISLGLIEETLQKQLGESEKPNLAVIVHEKENRKPEIIVFTTADSLTRESANQTLIQSGLSRLIKISTVKKVDEIPMLGTGKTDYRKLQDLS